MHHRETTPTKRKLPPEAVFSPSTPTLVTPPQPARPTDPEVHASPSSTSVTPPRPTISTPPSRRLRQKHSHSPKTPTNLSRPPLTLTALPEPTENEGSENVIEDHLGYQEERGHTTHTRVPPIWGWSPSLESATLPIPRQDQALLEYFGESFVPSVASASMTEEEEREIFDRIRDLHGDTDADADAEGEDEEFEITPFVFSTSTPGEAPPASPRLDSSPTLEEGFGLAFSNSCLAESVAAFEAAMESRRLSASSTLPDVPFEAVPDEDSYGATMPTARPRLPLRVTNPSLLGEVGPLSPSDFLRQARAIVQDRVGKRLGTPPPPPHRRSFSLPERPRVALDDGSSSPPHLTPRPILTNTVSRSSAAQFGWDDDLQTIAPDALSRNTRRQRSKSEAPITDIIIKSWVDRNWDGLQAEYHRKDKRELAEAEKWLHETETMPRAKDGVDGLGLGMGRVRRRPVPATGCADVDTILPEAVPMTRATSITDELASANARHGPRLANGNQNTSKRHTGKLSESPPISTVLGRSQVSLWLNQQRHIQQTETIKEKVRSRPNRRQRDELRHKEPGVTPRKDRSKRRSSSPGGPRPMVPRKTEPDVVKGHNRDQKPLVDSRLLDYKFPAVSLREASPSSVDTRPPLGTTDSPTDTVDEDEIPQDSTIVAGSPRDNAKDKDNITEAQDRAVEARAIEEPTLAADTPRDKGKGKAKATEEEIDMFEADSGGAEEDAMDVDTPRDKGKGKTMATEKDYAVDADAEGQVEDMDIDHEDGFDAGAMRLAIALSTAESLPRMAFDLLRTAGESSSSPARASSSNEVFRSITPPPGLWLGGLGIGLQAPCEIVNPNEDLTILPGSTSMPPQLPSSESPTVPTQKNTSVITTSPGFSLSVSVQANTFFRFDDTASAEDHPASPLFLARGSGDPVANLPPTTQATQELGSDAPAETLMENRMWLAMPDPDWSDNLRIRHSHNGITSATPVIMEPYQEREVPEFTITPPTPEDEVSFAQQQDAPDRAEPSARVEGLLRIPPKNSTTIERRRNSWHAEPPPPVPLLMPSNIDITERMMSRIERQWEQHRIIVEASIGRINKSLGLEPVELPRYSAAEDRAQREAERKRGLAKMRKEERAAGASPPRNRERRRGTVTPRTDMERPRLGRSLSHHILGVRNIDGLGERKDELKASRSAPRPPTTEDLTLRRVTTDTPPLDMVLTPQVPQLPSHPRLRLIMPTAPEEDESSSPPAQTPRDAGADPRSPVALKRIKFAPGTNEPRRRHQAGIPEVVVDALAGVVTGALGLMWRSLTGGRENR